MKTCEAQENCLEVYLHVQVRLAAGRATPNLGPTPSP
jgi:hypothetical protein